MPNPSLHPWNKGISGFLHRWLEEGWFIAGDQSSPDRLALIKFSLSGNIVANLIGGNFFTGLLLLMQADDGFVGLMTILNFAANLLQFAAPYILERFERRKKLLIALRVAIHAVNIVLIGLIPLLPLDRQPKLVAIAAAVIAVNVCNALMAPGFSVWHIAHVPPRTRVSYYAVVTVLAGVAVAVVNLLASTLVDGLKAGGQELLGLEMLRIIALAVAVLDILFLLRIRELPREGGVAPVRFTQLLRQPWREKVYLRSVLVVFLWNAIANLPGPFYTVYLLKNLGISYTFINAVSLVNVLVLIFLTPVWRRIFNRLSWLQPLSWGMLLLAPHYLGLALVTRQTVFLYPVFIIWSFICVCGINLAFSSMAFLNIPHEKQTLFVGFYSTMASLGALLGVSASRFFVTSLTGASWQIGSMVFTEKQALMVLAGLLMFAAGLTVRRIQQKNVREGREY